MSKSSELDQTAKRYIISCIDASGYCEHEPDTIPGKIDFLQKTFYSEAGWNVKRIGLQPAVQEWLQGLPTACTVAFSNHDILQLAKSWGSLPDSPTEKQEDKILDNYFKFIAGKVCQLFNGYHVPKDL